MPDAPRSRRHPVLVSLVTMFAVVLTLLGTAGTASAHLGTEPATPSNMTDSHPWPYDGCSTPGARINSQPGVFDFLHACIHHDGCYGGYDRFGDPDATISRLRCDNTFLADMRASCAEEHQSDPNSQTAMQCRNTATLYYTAVRLFGRQFYRGGGSAF